ncbi:MAG: Mechanosensitive channel MscK precursor, partial [Pseudomonadota bacterium]
MTSVPIMMHDPALWWSRMNSQEALLELVLFFACIAMAWLVVWGVRRVTSQWELSVLLGKKLLDGVLFPVLLLGMVFVMRAVWARSHPLWIFDFLVPVCLSLASIRLGVKVLQATFK